MNTHVALVHAEPGESTGDPSLAGLPQDLLHQSARRLRILALLYAAVFFLAGVFPAFIVPSDRARFLGSVTQWGPPCFSIVMALVLWATLRTGNVSLPRTMMLGLGFEVLTSYGIATAEFMGAPALPTDPDILLFHGLSWVAVWVLLFTIVMPAPPRRVLFAALASVSSVPVMLLALGAVGLSQLHLSPLQFFFGMVFPYLLVVCMAYAGARVVYALTAEVKRARELGSYRLEEKLGQGGMGEVWLARHRLLARPAAVKVMRPPSPSAIPAQHDRIRFEREAQVIATLRSPHTVNLFDFGVANDGSFYYAMELLDGFDADDLVRRFGPVPAARAIHLLRQVCHSLSEAETHQVVHRDIKPANIYLCRYGEDYDFIKVLDFGLAKLNREISATGLTGANVVQGTPAFMAPEQAMGQPVDARTDIYATGCVAYWLVTGHLVFEAPTAIGLLMHHAKTQPTAPSLRSELPIPAALDDLIMQCLAKNPEDRPRSANDLAQRLEAVSLTERWTQGHAREWWTRVRPSMAAV